jgi:hypothetical protein
MQVTDIVDERFSLLLIKWLDPKDESTMLLRNCFNMA